jgi:hypothetical protein
VRDASSAEPRAGARCVALPGLRKTARPDELRIEQGKLLLHSNDVAELVSPGKVGPITGKRGKWTTIEADEITYDNREGLFHVKLEGVAYQTLRRCGDHQKMRGAVKGTG